jgi:GDP-L-fucose synthase
VSRIILVTGGGGFLGGHVVDALRARGADPIVVRSGEHDLTDPAQTRRLFQTVRPELVFHLAGRVGGIGANRDRGGTFFRDNMAMGLNVLEEARRAGTKKVVIAGSVCAYPKHAPVPFREGDLWNGYPDETNAPFGVAKKALLVMAQAYRQEFGCNFVTLLPVNLYGPRDHFHRQTAHVIPAVIRKLDDARRDGAAEVVLWGDGSPTREFLYVADAAQGMVLAAERYDEPEPVNLGAGLEISIRELAAMIAELVGYRGRLAWDPTQPNGQPRRRLDVSRAWERFGFRAATPLADGLRLTVEWYRAHEAGR